MAAGEHLDAFLWECRVAVGQVLETSDRAVSKSKLDDDGFDEPRPAVSKSLCGHSAGAAFREVAGEVEEVAELTDDPTATDYRVVQPVASRQGPGVHSADD